MKKGFTLAELLIALVILGVIATFAIPKVLTAQTDARSNSIAKEAVAAVSEAYQIYKANNAINASTQIGHLTPFMNYVKYDTASIVDHKNSFGSINCATTNCIVLHNGGMLWWSNTFGAFGNTASTNAMGFGIDPDGKYGGSTTGPSKAAEFYLYTDGALRTRNDVKANTYDGAGGPYNPVSNSDPSWLSWN